MKTTTSYAIITDCYKYILSIHPTKAAATKELKRWDSEFYRIVKIIDTMPSTP
jgi:hypothetical protein